jgi:hypothetical protein
MSQTLEIFSMQHVKDSGMLHKLAEQKIKLYLQHIGHWYNVV